MKTTLIFFLIFSSNLYAGIFGPSSYEECLLNNMKGVQSDAAAQAIVQACRIKFPLTPTKQEPVAEYPKNYTFNGLDIESNGMTIFNNKIPINKVQLDHIGENYGGGIKSDNFLYYDSIHVTNRNSFPVNNILIGVIKSGNKCLWDSKNYSEFYECEGSVGSMKSSEYRCFVPNAEKTNRKYCIIGFTVKAYPSDIQKFIKLND